MTIPDQAVIVNFSYASIDPMQIFNLEIALEAALATAMVGQRDGQTVTLDGSDGFLYIYGADADRLFAVIRPILERCPFMRGARVTRRYGPPAGRAREIQTMLSF